MILILPLLDCSTKNENSVTSNTHSVARQWNEVLLDAIRIDLARPPVHARNLFHLSTVMYDAWAVFDNKAETFLLGKKINGFECPFSGVETKGDIQPIRETAISYAAYRLLSHRFKNSPVEVSVLTQLKFDKQLNDLGYDSSITSTDYSTGSGAALGNYIAECMISFGLQDGANEDNNYQNQYYQPVNPPLDPKKAGNPDIVDPDRWQSLNLDTFIDQSGNIINGKTIPFLGAEWGKVTPFALKNSDKNVYLHDDIEYWIYHDPGPPHKINNPENDESVNEYVWSFSLVVAWSSHLDPKDGVMWDISPGSLGNNLQYPHSAEEYKEFFNLADGGDWSKGHKENPFTHKPYETNLALRGDYTRVLAEYWADGPNSETPPGHWFVILNKVNDHPELKKRFHGEGDALDNLEWDVKSYFILGSAMHDAAISAWSIKGWYDYVRPVSAIRFMADKGQSSDPSRQNYSSQGFKLVPGLIETVKEGDPLAGVNQQNIGKIKVYAWRGPRFINNPSVDTAGVDWILAEQWWPYQRPTFVTPPFAGYVSGHSTFSRAAAEVLTLLTGDEYFPGGISEYHIKKMHF